MLACVYPSENFHGKAPVPVTKVRHGKSGPGRKKTKLLASKEITGASESRLHIGSAVKTTHRKFVDTNTALGTTVTTYISPTSNNEVRFVVLAPAERSPLVLFVFMKRLLYIRDQEAGSFFTFRPNYSMHFHCSSLKPSPLQQ